MKVTVKNLVITLIGLIIIFSIILNGVLKARAKELDSFIDYRNDVAVKSYLDKEIGNVGSYCLDKRGVGKYTLTWDLPAYAVDDLDQCVLIMDIEFDDIDDIESSGTNTRAFIDGRFYTEEELFKNGYLKNIIL